MATGQYINTTVSDIIDNYINDSTYLPAIQREFVWNPDQICKLFDSLMCGYPISSFLFWRIREEDKKTWNAYEFVRDFDRANPHNTEANLDGVNKDIFLVLDGQQRMTALNIGLKGSYSYFYYRKRKEFLYINLLKKADAEVNPDELSYGFDFLENNPKNNSSEYWYKVGNILNFERAREARDSIKAEIESYSEEEQKIIEDNLEDLHNMVHTAKSINYYEEKSKDYDKVVEIFVRTNTGGVKLEYSDILLSTATAKWKKLNARKEIHDFTDEINKIGPTYKFGKDFVMKGAMYLTDGLPIQYKVSSFTRSNLEKIEDNWDNIKDAISKVVQLISQYGFTDKNIVSRNALLPVAYYISRHPEKNYVYSSDAAIVKDKNNIMNWIILVSIRNIFGRSSDNMLKICQNVLKSNSPTSFPFKELNKQLSMEPKLGDTEIDNFLYTKYSTRYSFLLLSLLYPNRDWLDKKYNEDHIYPYSEFSRSKLSKRGYNEKKINSYLSHFNTIINLELLEEKENNEKRAHPFDEWIKSRDNNFKERHLIPEIASYDFDDFENFINKRKELIISRLKEIKFE